MKSLIIVSAALGIFTGTTAKAQTSVNIQKLSVSTDKKQPKFIEGIETKSESVVLQQTVTAKTDVVKVPVLSVKLPAARKAVKTFTANIEDCTPLQFKYAQLLNVTVESVTNTKLFEFIEDWWATRYRYGGTTKHGIDCSALTGALLKDVYGQQMPRTAREQHRVTTRLNRNELQEGDLVFFNTRGGVSHVGVYVGNNSFVHASVHSGVTISSLNDTYYASKYIGGGRYNGTQQTASEEETEEGTK